MSLRDYVQHKAGCYSLKPPTWTNMEGNIQHTCTCGLDALLAEGAAEGWQPIESAPKDGTRILAYRDSSICVVWWTLSGVWNEWHAKAARIRIEPTHWMPIPLPPVRPSKE